jgi:flagellar biosynthetic protein FliQ
VLACWAVDLPSLVVEALQLALWLATPALAACLCVALITSVMQGALQASDPSIGFVPKLFAVLGALWLSYGFLAEHMTTFSGKVFALMAQL